MNNNYWKQIKRDFLKDINNKHIFSAIENLRQLSVALDIHQYDTTLYGIENSYKSLRQYAISENRTYGLENTINDIIVQLITISDILSRQYLISNSTSIYYKYINKLDTDSVSSKTIYEEYCNAFYPDEKYKSLKKLFVYIWTKFPLSATDIKTIEIILSEDAFASKLIISAILLGHLQYFEKNRLTLLTKAYLSESIDMSARSLVALIISLSYYSNSWIRLSALKEVVTHVSEEKSNWIEEIKAVMIRLIRTRDTERINNILKNDIIPNLMKITPEIRNKYKDLNPDEMGEFIDDENSELMELLDETGVSEKMRELSEMHTKGSDVMLGTFSGLKYFPFFNDCENWFMPFNINNPEITAIPDFTFDNVTICDSDKYSMMLMLASIPPSQRTHIINQLKIEKEQSDMENDSALYDARVDKISAYSNLYIHDLYRFFKLYNKKEDFKDIFDKKLDFFDISNLLVELNETDILTEIAEEYLSNQCFDEALKTLLKINKENLTVSEYQKIGFCYQKTNKIEEAIKAYETADLLDSSRKWTIKRLAVILFKQNRFDDALKYYRRLSELEQENPSVSYHVAFCYEKIGDFSAALNNYYKTLFLDEKSVSARLGLSRVSYIKEDIAKSLKYATEAIEIKENSDTICQLALVYFNSGKLSDAIRLLHKIDKINFNYISETIKKSNLNSDIKLLVEDEFYPS